MDLRVGGQTLIECSAFPIAITKTTPWQLKTERRKKKTKKTNNLKDADKDSQLANRPYSIDLHVKTKRKRRVR